MARGEAVHCVGDWNQRQGAELVGDRREIGGLLRVAAEQDRVAGLEQRVDVVVTRHHVERVLGDDAGRHMQDEAADFLADGDVVRFQPVQDALAGRGVRNVFAAGQGCAERAALRGMFPLGLEEERMPVPDIATAVRTEGLVDLRDLGGWRDRIADHSAAHPAHDFSDGAIAMNDGRNPWVLDAHFRSHLEISVGRSLARCALSPERGQIDVTNPEATDRSPRRAIQSAHDLCL